MISVKACWSHTSMLPLHSYLAISHCPTEMALQHPRSQNKDFCILNLHPSLGLCLFSFQQAQLMSLANQGGQGRG